MHERHPWGMGSECLRQLWRLLGREDPMMMVERLNYQEARVAFEIWRSVLACAVGTVSHLNWESAT